MVVEAAPPAVGPEPASREASGFVTFSISAVHCPPSAILMGKATRTQTPNIHSITFMATFLPAEIAESCASREFRRFDINRRNEPTFRWSERVTRWRVKVFQQGIRSSKCRITAASLPGLGWRKCAWFVCSGPSRG